jgi:hypothetical protein
MGERNIDIWKKILDWIVECGGIALINTPPDYAHFADGSPGEDDYPSHYYQTFLQYVKSQYEGQYWHALPGDMGQFWSMGRLNDRGR